MSVCDQVVVIVFWRGVERGASFVKMKRREDVGDARRDRDDRLPN